jgi:acyl carrier protein phosphodiesterase
MLVRRAGNEFPDYKIKIFLMNHLAHFFLSDNQEDLMIGNFIADFIKNKAVPHYSKGIQNGIFLHRQIDMFTDTHAAVRQSTARLRPTQSRYAPVVNDVLYDFILGNAWATYHSTPLSDFCGHIYTVLDNRITDLPENMQLFVPKMIEDRFLERYATETGLRASLARLQRRAPAANDFQKAVDVLLENYVDFEEDFTLFFPELIQRAKKCRDEELPHLMNF